MKSFLLLTWIHFNRQHLDITNFVGPIQWVIPENIRTLPRVASWNSEGMGGVRETGIPKAWGVLETGIPLAWGGGGGISILIFKGVKELEIRLTMLIAFDDCSTNASHRLEAHGIHLLVGAPGKWQLPVTRTLGNPHRISHSVEPK